MPGVQQATPGGQPRRSDRVAIGVLTRTYPPALVDRVLAACGRVERRHRLLPARLVVYYVLALLAGVAYEEVLRCLVEALRGAPWWPHRREPWRVWRIPAKSALVQARARLVGLGECGTHAITKVAIGPTAPGRPPWPRRWWRG
jgi:hypothetical protein